MKTPHAHKTTHPNDCTPLGVLSYNETQGLFVKRTTSTKVVFSIVWEDRAGRFGLIGKEVSIRYANGTKENPHACEDFRFFRDGDEWVMTYIKNSSLIIATAHDIYSWIIRGKVGSGENPNTVVVSLGAHRHLLYKSGLFATHASSTDFKKWTDHPELLFTARPDFFDAGSITLVGASRIPQGILVIYDASRADATLNRLAAGAVLFSTEDPKRILWRSSLPVWEGLVYSKDEVLTPLGVVFSEGELALYWSSVKGSIVRAIIDAPTPVFADGRPRQKLLLKKSAKNPILTPKPHHEWENQAVFNPAAIYEDGRVHVLYRAIGHNGLSVLGYASSADGFNFDERPTQPVFTLQQPRQLDDQDKIYSPMYFPSGGSWGGCEDPRLVKIENNIYLTFNAFDDWNSIRIGASKISEDDFRNKRWNWTEPLLISPPGQVHKNWVLFPEKIAGKFAILHSVTPTVKVEYVNSLEELANGKKIIRSNDPKRVPGVPGRWDTYVRGIGPPPLKTALGWLVFYHGWNKHDNVGYKLGAMLLDHDNPEKIIARSAEPILAPDMWYENEGKPGIVYACGAVLNKGLISIYYGGGDKHTCVASADINDLITHIKKGGPAGFKMQSPLALSL